MFFNKLIAQQSFVKGPEAPSVTFQQSIGTLPKPDFYRGKILVIDFWATWCAPCIAGFPDFNKLADSYKGNKTILFSAITDEPKSTVALFFKRTQKQLNGLKLIDTTKQTKKNFGILFIPYCIVIDKDNIIRWKGISSDLNKSILDKVILNEAPEPKIFTAQASITNKPIAQRALFAFNVAKTDSGKNNYEGSGWQRNYKRYIAALSDGNIPLNEFIEKISGFSSTTRITSNSISKLKQHVDVYLNFGTDTAKYGAYKNTILPDAPDRNLILNLLSLSLDFKIEVVEKRVTHYQLAIADTSRLHSFKSMQTGHSSFSDDNYPQFEIVGYNLKDIISNLESSAKLIITDPIVDQNLYDLSLDISNEKALKKSLLFHGLKLEEVTDEVSYMAITFNHL